MRAPRSARARKEAAAADAAARSARILEEERARDAAWRRAVLQVRKRTGTSDSGLLEISLQMRTQLGGRRGA